MLGRVHKKDTHKFTATSRHVSAAFVCWQRDVSDLSIAGLDVRPVGDVSDLSIAGLDVHEWKVFMVLHAANTKNNASVSE